MNKKIKSHLRLPLLIGGFLLVSTTPSSAFNMPFNFGMDNDGPFFMLRDGPRFWHFNMKHPFGRSGTLYPNAWRNPYGRFYGSNSLWQNRFSQWPSQYGYGPQNAYRPWGMTPWRGRQWPPQQNWPGQWGGTPWQTSPFSSTPWSGSPWSGSRWGGSPWSGSRWGGSPFGYGPMNYQPMGYGMNPMTGISPFGFGSPMGFGSPFGLF